VTMRKLERTRTATAVHRSFRGTSRIQFESQLLKAERQVRRGDAVKHVFPSKWNVVKDQLLLETHDKCAYCETPTSVVAYGDVEHFRPKSTYWWLAYCYDNYAASCTLCNQKYKKAAFPILKSRMRAPLVKKTTTDKWINERAGKFTPDPLNEDEGLSWADFAVAHNAERPLLPDPYLDEPTDHFIWQVSMPLEEVRLAPKPGSPLAKQMVQAVESSLGLNRKELCRLRFEVYLSYSTHRITAESSMVPVDIRHKNATVVQRMIRPEGAYSAMLAYFEGMPTEELP